MVCTLDFSQLLFHVRVSGFVLRRLAGYASQTRRTSGGLFLSPPPAACWLCGYDLSLSSLCLSLVATDTNEHITHAAIATADGGD